MPCKVQIIKDQMVDTRRRIEEVISKLEKDGKTIKGLRVPQWAAVKPDLGFVRYPDTKNAYQFDTYDAVVEPEFPCDFVTIEFN